MTTAAGAAAFLLVWTYMLGPDGTPVGGDLTIQPMASMEQCELVGDATRTWLQGHFTDGASWTCVPGAVEAPETAPTPEEDRAR